MIKQFHKVMEYKEGFPPKKYHKDGVIHYSHLYNVIEYNCPCGCGTSIFINSKGYMASATTWDIKLVDGTITVHPSILMNGGCKSHYFIRGNKVDWCSDSPILKHINKQQQFTCVTEFKEWYPSNFKEIIKKGIIYNSKEHDSVAFLCPCGCGAIETIKQGSQTQIPNTKWKFKIKEGKVTIRPSMYMRECKTSSHYWITENEIKWV